MLVPTMAVAGAGCGFAVGRSGVDTALGGVLGVLFGLVLVPSEWMKAVQAEAAKRSVRFDSGQASGNLSPGAGGLSGASSR